jgi:hypothetical protein
MKQICQLSRPPAAFIVLIPECKLVATGCINREATVCGDPGGSSSCYVFLSYHCARNGLPLGPSSLLRHTSLSRTDYDSLLLIMTHY